MRPLRLTIFFISFFFLKAKAQNLVYNPGFESYNVCPSNLLSMPYSSDYSYFPTITWWTNPVRLSSPDYLNQCAVPTSGLQVPNTTFGYQQPHSGAAYAGIIAFQGQMTNGTLSYDYREYLQNRLAQPMVAGKQYCVSFYVSPTISPAFNFNYVALDEFGLNFSQQRPIDTVNRFISLPYHIKNISGTYLSDTSKWYKISGIYMATGGEEWLTIGCFANGSSPSFINVYPATPNQNILYWTYLYIDDVSVSEITSADTINRTADTVVCRTAGLNIPLKSENGATAYSWSDGSTGSQIMAQDTGTYWCIAKTECGLVKDSFHIRFQPYTPLDLGRDTFNCHAQPVTITAGNNYLSYLWNTGANTSSITVFQTGSYVLTVHDTCGEQKDTVEITIQAPTPAPVVNDTTICQFVPSPELNVSGTNLTWYQSATALAGSASQPYVFTGEPGYYTLLVSQTIGRCESPRVPITIKVKYKPDADIGNYYALCGGTDTLIGNVYPEVTYLWNTGDESCCIQPEQTGTYQLTIENECGASSDTAFVEVFPCDECVFVPTAFTPNGDGKNDRFYPIVKCPVYNYHLSIFNRWGQMIFNTNNISDYWNGEYKSHHADCGVYVYTLEYNSAKTKSHKSLKGNITLIR